MPRISRPTVAEHRDAHGRALLDAAHSVLDEPREAPSPSEVAERAGLAQTSADQYFGSEQELLQAMVRDICPQWVARTSSAVTDAPTVADDVLAYAVANLELVAEGAHAVGTALAALEPAAAVDEQASRMHREVQAPLIDSLTARGVEDPQPPAMFHWYRAEPDARVRNALSFQWQLRSAISSEKWTLPLGIWADARLIGCQDVSAVRFAERRTVSSGSWLALDAHGRGYGTLMRQAMLVFAFDHLGAQRAESSAVIGNDASFGVSRACGYREDGTQVSTMPGPVEVEQRFLVTTETFRRPRVPVRVEGLTAPLREMLGA